MLNALSVELSGGNPRGQSRAARAFERQGFVNSIRFDWSGGTLSAWAHPAQRQVRDCSVQTRTGSACCVGPLWYQGRFGADALPLLLDEITTAGRVEETALRGNFALFVQSGDHCWLLNDALGFLRLYASSDGCFYSTSWLATCAYLDRVELDEAAAIEYVLLGAAHSESTVARNVSLLPLGYAYDLEHRRIWPRFPSGIFSGTATFASFDEAADAAAAHLHTVFGEITSAFPDTVNAALSGGFDSRLIVAGLLACGSKPHLFVYGGPESADVAIARTAARVADLPLSVIDKRTIDEALPPPDVECLVRSALFFDGLPNDGIYDAGADRQTRLQQNADGRIALNGGGGEIFRNFFHLPARDFGAGDIVRTFYRGFDPAVFRHAHALPAYEERLAASILSLPGISDRAAATKLDRSQVELVYPLFRCHYWMSVNNSVAVRHGYYATPLVDLQSVRNTYALPLTWKTAGRLESRLIADLHQNIASQPTIYGFRFSNGPDWRARMAEWATCMRPIVARPIINAARRRLRKLGVTPDMLRHCRALLPGEWQLDPVLDLTRLPDGNAFARALAVEIAWRELGA